MDQEAGASISEWLALATDTKEALMASAQAGSTKTVGLSQWDAKCVATAIAIRSAARCMAPYS